MRIDLHTHSLCSDGTDSPSELMELASAAGLDAVGLVDHDTVAGWTEAEAAAQRGVKLVRGMEVTAQYEGISVHILAYLFNPEHPQVIEHISSVRTSRKTRAQEIVDRIAADYPLTWNDVVEAAAPGATIGRPHIADALVNHGIVTHRSAAFDSILSSSSKYYVQQYAPDAIDVVKFIDDAGGKSVFAHPWALQRGRIVPDRAFGELAAAGLFGVEVDHRDNPRDTREKLAAIVDSCGLARFGSSDFHGTGKPNALGENTTSAEVYSALITGTYLEVR